MQTPRPSSGIRKRRPRNPLSCENCRFSKLRCDRQIPCSTCRRRRLAPSCAYRDRASLAHSSPATIYPGGTETTFTPTQSHGQSESQLSTHGQWEAVLQRPAADQSDLPAINESQSFLFSRGPQVSKQELIDQLPPHQCVEYLLSQYFAHIAPLFHILHGPSFQKEYVLFTQKPAEDVSLSWLALLFAILALMVTTLDSNDPVISELWTPSSPNPAALSTHLQSLTMTCLGQDQFLIRHNLTTLSALLVSIYTICHNEGAERTWLLLGIALNMAIALRCNVDLPNLTCLESERRRRCWTGVMLLHTYQAISFRDVDLFSLIKANPSPPADVNDVDVTDDCILPPSSHPTQLSVTTYKVRLFHLSARVCAHISGPLRLEKPALKSLDASISEHQADWSATFLTDGQPSILDVDNYAYWCVLETYAHQLYLLIHRPFCNSNSPNYLSGSRDRCIASSLALLDIHRQFCELPRLRQFKWLVHGLVCFNALHGAVALVSCLLDRADTDEIAEHVSAYQMAVVRLEKLQTRSPVCAKAYSILRHLQQQLHLEQDRPVQPTTGRSLDNILNDWVHDTEWFNPYLEFWDLDHAQQGRSVSNDLQA